MSDTPTTPPADDKKQSSAPPSAIAQNKNTILMGLGAALALGVPASISQIGSPVTRVVLSFAGLVIVFGLGYFVTPRRK